MYEQEKYLKQDPAFLFQFMNQHPFATFVTQADHLLATHIPLLTDGTAENFRLFGHVAYNNPQFERLKDGMEVLLIFQGAHGYISSSWYKEKSISTWNYSAVHVNARIKVQRKKELEASLARLGRHFEEDQENPHYYKDIPKDMLEDHLPLIKGFWCEPFKIQGISKMSQGHEEDVPSILQHLKKGQEQTALRREIEKEHKLPSKGS